jgi:plasmid maintenance system antidote protein VapI
MEGTRRMTLHPFTPDWVCCPGETLAEWFEYTKLPTSLCTHHGISEDTFARLLVGDEPIDGDLARKLLNLTLIPAPFWLAMEHNYRAGLRAGLSHVCTSKGTPA